MKLKKKQEDGLTVTEENYAKFYPELSKKLSYAEFCGEAVIDISTHCIGESQVKLANGEFYTVYYNVNDDLTTYCYHGEFIWLYRDKYVRNTGNVLRPFKCRRIPILPNYYLDCEFGQAMLVYIPQFVGKDPKQAIKAYFTDDLPEEVKREVADLLVSTPDSCYIINCLRRFVREEIYNATV